MAKHSAESEQNPIVNIQKELTDRLLLESLHGMTGVMSLPVSPSFPVRRQPSGSPDVL